MSYRCHHGIDLIALEKVEAKCMRRDIKATCRPAMTFHTRIGLPYMILIKIIMLMEL